MSEKISYIKTNNSLKTIEKSHEIKRAVVDRIKNNIDVDALRSSGHINNELILFVCNVIEELCKKKYQINKKEFAVEIITAIFSGLSAVDSDNIRHQIDYSHQNGLIHKVPLKNKVASFAINWFKRKFL